MSEVENDEVVDDSDDFDPQQLVDELVQDRERLLDALGVTEHEWACSGGRRFSVKELSLWDAAAVKQASPPTVETEEAVTVIEVPPLSEHVHEFASDGSCVCGIPPLPAVPPLPIGVPPLPPPLPVSAVALPPPPPPTSSFDAFRIESVNSGLWGDATAPAPRAFEWTEEQREALDEIEEWNPYMSGSQTDESFLALTGPAGTGKSTLIREVTDKWATAALAAMTGKAALRLTECAERAATTLHKVLYYPPKGGEDTRFTRLREPPSSFVVVDEASMMTPTVYADCRKWARLGVRFLLVGDVFQLPPVITDKREREAYGDDYSVFSVVGGASLRTVMRNAGGVLRAATRVRETGVLPTASDEGYEFARETQPLLRAVEDYCADRDDHLLITWRNQVRMDANAKIRERLGREGPLPDRGEPVLVRKNGQGFLNGEIATAGLFEEGPDIGPVKTLWMELNGIKTLVSYQGGDQMFDGMMPKIEDWKAYHVALKKNDYPEPLPCSFGYCVTAHAAQGSEARRVTVFLETGDQRNSHFKKPTTLPDGTKASFAARFLYTALTRGKKSATMIVGR